MRSSDRKVHVPHVERVRRPLVQVAVTTPNGVTTVHNATAYSTEQYGVKICVTGYVNDHDGDL